MEDRLEELKEYVKYRRGKTPDNIRWLITQAEWASFYSGKAGKLNVFLQERVSGRAGDNVIDVAMDYIRYLEKELNNK